MTALRDVMVERRAAKERHLAAQGVWEFAQDGGNWAIIDEREAERCHAAAEAAAAKLRQTRRELGSRVRDAKQALVIARERCVVVFSPTRCGRAGLD